MVMFTCDEGMVGEDVGGKVLQRNMRRRAKKPAARAALQASPELKA